MAQEAPAKPAGKRKGSKKKVKKVVPNAVAHIQATFNNTVITITDTDGNTLAWASAGSLGLRGSRKGTPFAAQQAAQKAGYAAKEHGVKQIEVRVKGPSGRRSRHQGDQRCNAHPSQRMPAAEATQSLTAGAREGSGWIVRRKSIWDGLQVRYAGFAEEKTRSCS
jgi:small subunit ribosomal protein S11